MMSLRRSEYTGENRCYPCTIINMVLAVAFAGFAFVFLVLTISTPVAGGSAFLIVAISLLLIWLRGYLVPGTPTLTRRYLPASVLAWFGKNSNDRSPPSNHDEFDLEAILLEAGILEPCAEVDDLCLEKSVAIALEENIRDLPDDTDEDVFLDAVDADRTMVKFSRKKSGTVLVVRGQRATQWPSESALIADIAIANILSSAMPNWLERTWIERISIIRAVRLFLPECPRAGGTVELTTRTVKSCCSEREVVEAICADSGDRFFEQPVQS